MSELHTKLESAFYEWLFAHAGVALIATDEELRLRVWNDAAVRLLHFDAESAEGRVLTDLIDPACRAEAESLFRRSLDDGSVHELEIQQPNGGDRPNHLAMTISPIVDDVGNRVGASACIRDITNRVVLQKKLAQNQKMASLGALAGGVAHHFNNLFGCIVTSVDYARDSGDPRALRRALEVTAETVTRATRLTDSLLMFAEGDHREVDLADLTETVLRFIETSEAQIEARKVRLVVSIEPVPVIAVPAIRLLTVLENLLENALDAMPSGGQLEIGLKPSNGRVLLRVADSGEGMGSEEVDRIFEPFYSTRTADLNCRQPHVGLGLAAAHGMVKELGGEIAVSSEPGRGSVFDILLPVSPEPRGCSAADR